MIKRTQLCLTVTALLGLTACAPQQFNPIAVNDKIGLNTPQDDDLSSNFFKLSDSQTAFQQDQLDQNKTSLSFRVQLPDGSFLNDLRASDLQIVENSVPVSNFTLESNSDKIVQTVDIVFTVDITGSMASTIESAKMRLINFVNTSRTQGFHSRMCLVTFGDYTVQPCTKFYDNDPAVPETQTQVNELISEISKLRAHAGAEDPGGTDRDENPMRALIDGSNAPWGVGSQRFLILVTDAGFLYSPGHSGTVGALAPQYNEIMRAITASQIQVFALTPSQPGYDQSFNGQPSIVTASQGEFFNYPDLVSGKISLDTILARIMTRIRTTYMAEYIADLVPGLNATLPIAKRKIQVQLKDGRKGTLIITSKQSNLPLGRPEYKRRFPLDFKNIDVASVKVKVDGALVTSGFSILKGELIFDQAPPAGAKIEVSYGFEALKDNLQFAPVLLDASIDLNSIKVLFNGIRTQSADVIFEKTLEGKWSVRPSELALANDDPFKIRAKGGLLIRVVHVKPEKAEKSE